MANLEQISPEIIGKIATVIDQKLKTLGEFSRESYGGVRAVSEMFNRLDSNSSKEILTKIEASDPSLVETIRHLMFVFEDLMLIDESGIKEILAKVDRKILTVALKGTSEQLKEHFLKAMSQRGADMLREDMDVMGAVKIKDVEAAQQQIIAIAPVITLHHILLADGALHLMGARDQRIRQHAGAELSVAGVTYRERLTDCHDPGSHRPHPPAPSP